MKKLWSVILAVCLAAAFALSMAACGGNGGEEAKKPTTDEIFAKFKDKIIDDAIAWEVIASKDELAEGEVPMFMVEDLKNQQYAFPEPIEFDPEWIISGTAATALMMTQSSRIYILEAKDADSLAKCQKAVADMHAQQVEVWSHYLPDQYELVENNISITRDNYLLYVTYQNAEDIKDIFDASFAG